MSRVLFPTAITPIDGPLVFLAGPIQGAPDWQAEAIRWFTEHAPWLSVASPRRLDRSQPFDYAAQVDWETHHLRRAARCGVILFWLAREAVPVPGRAYAQTSRFELAEWKVRHERDGVRLAVGIEDGFSGARYIRHRFGQDCPGVPLASSMSAACAAAVELAGRSEQAEPDAAPSPPLSLG
ncbi:nucleoside 2-deoxyribosyltransferase domain-containing protein [Gemmata sp. JC673]|uniref:Nucleoside 2-deoxyribosyltransferase domain-containing protein n=1 Tax=Gemmata algarum TaxID=2975278 RepID=A0ABU5F417_9BACT|nr:nucleoside 2-deoxyribosyltransferase domain-containing protein [Gemmata algarum]MDY3562141.1 nucleoside 2-deoxyribosyltransferase domain-containing protein [Gemmata algarum]